MDPSHDIPCQRPGHTEPANLRVTGHPIPGVPRNVRLEIEGQGQYTTVMVDAQDLIQALMAAWEQASPPVLVVPYVLLEAVIEAAWDQLNDQGYFNPFGSCPECKCGLWPVDEWNPTGSARCGNCGAVVEKTET